MKRPLLRFLLTCFSLLIGVESFAMSPEYGETLNTDPPFAKWTDTELLLNNGLVQRTIKLPTASAGTFLTTSYKPVTGEFRYFQKTNADFQFELNDAVYSGSGDWKLVTIQKITDTRQGDGAAVTLQSKDGKVELTVNFLLYPNLPVIRKSLTVKNLTNEPVRLESVDVEKFTVTPYNAT
ncbi:MAG TPA: alpha-galactosidase, partial [Fibrella sp.]